MPSLKFSILSKLIKKTPLPKSFGFLPISTTSDFLSELLLYLLSVSSAYYLPHTVLYYTYVHGLLTHLITSSMGAGRGHYTFFVIYISPNTVPHTQWCLASIFKTINNSILPCHPLSWTNFMPYLCDGY